MVHLGVDNTGNYSLLKQVGDNFSSVYGTEIIGAAATGVDSETGGNFALQGPVKSDFGALKGLPETSVRAENDPSDFPGNSLWDGSPSGSV